MQIVVFFCLQMVKNKSVVDKSQDFVMVDGELKSEEVKLEITLWFVAQ